MANTSTEQTLKNQLPFHGELHKAPKKLFQETILLVPFYGARKASLKRHVEFLNELGYDVLNYEIYKDSRNLSQKLVSSNELMGVKHIWADQVEAMLNSVPGKKIIFSFSNPSASAIEATVRRNATDVAGLICDSGPSGDLLSSMINYFTHEEPIAFFPLKWAAAAAMTFLWSPKFIEAIHADLEKLPQGFKVLSIRGWKDKLIPAHLIDQVFEPHLKLEWQKLSLPQAGHLNGLRDFREEYESPVRLFLESISTRI